MTSPVSQNDYANMSTEQRDALAESLLADGEKEEAEDKEKRQAEEADNRRDWESIAHALAGLPCLAQDALLQDVTHEDRAGILPLLEKTSAYRQWASKYGETKHADPAMGILETCQEERRAAMALALIGTRSQADTIAGRLYGVEADLLGDGYWRYLAIQDPRVVNHRSIPTEHGFDDMYNEFHDRLMPEINDKLLDQHYDLTNRIDDAILTYHHLMDSAGE